MSASRDHAPPITAVTSGQSHTPGPWRLVDGRATGFKTASGGESILADARPTDDFFILMIAEMETNVPAAERAANARLIAAAPELLSQLRATEAWLTAALDCPTWSWDADQHEAATEARDGARAAISKATGEPQ